jgi:ABC-type enterochelin transport system permease subunit
MKDKLLYVVTVMVTATLCAVIMSLIGAMIFGLFSKEISSKDQPIFNIIGPLAQTIVGGLIGWLSGLKAGNDMAKQPSVIA